MTAVTERKEDRLPLYLGGKIIVYNAKSLNKYDHLIRWVGPGEVRKPIQEVVFLLR